MFSALRLAVVGATAGVLAIAGGAGAALAAQKGPAIFALVDALGACNSWIGGRLGPDTVVVVVVLWVEKVAGKGRGRHCSGIAGMAVVRFWRTCR